MQNIFHRGRIHGNCVCISSFMLLGVWGLRQDWGWPLPQTKHWPLATPHLPFSTGSPWQQDSIFSLSETLWPKNNMIELIVKLRFYSPPTCPPPPPNMHMNTHTDILWVILLWWPALNDVNFPLESRKWACGKSSLFLKLQKRADHLKRRPVNTSLIFFSLFLSFFFCTFLEG